MKKLILIALIATLGFASTYSADSPQFRYLLDTNTKECFLVKADNRLYNPLKASLDYKDTRVIEHGHFLQVNWTSRISGKRLSGFFFSELKACKKASTFI